MNKKILISIFLIFTSFSLFAGPFGLSMGMTLEEITAACGGKQPQKLEDNDSYRIEPLKKHSLFTSYNVRVDSEEGLYSIRCFSNPVHCEKDGKEIQNKFNSFVPRMEKIYGKPKITDKMIQVEPLYKGDSFWLYSLDKGYRELSATWISSYPKQLFKDDLYLITLWANATHYKEEGYLILDYSFINELKVTQEEDKFL